MNGSYAELRDIAVSQDLKERLMMAVADVSKDVYIDAEETEQHKTYAVQVIMNPRPVAEQMAVAVVLVAQSDSDEDLKTAVKTVFNVFANTVS